jgi:hypothetical protein
MATADVGVDLVTRLKDKGFKDLEKSSKKQDKVLGALGKRLAAAFSIAAVVNFGKASVKAFQESQKEANRLRTQLDSLNLGFAQPFLTDFIQKTQLATGISGGVLTDAFNTLSQATNDVTTAQRLLAVSLDISAATGRDLSTVTTALQRGFAGQTTALTRLKIGFTTANLKGRDFDDVLTELETKFTGSSARAADTLEGKLARLTQAVDEAKEAFGEGLVKGLDDSGVAVEDLQKDVINLGEALGLLAGKTTGFIASVNKDVQKYFEESDRAIAKFVRNIAGNITEITRLEEERGRAALRARGQIFKTEKENAKERAAEEARRAKEEKAAAAEKARKAKREALENKARFKVDADLINLSAALRRGLNDKDKAAAIEAFNLKKSGYENDINAIKTLENTQRGYYNFLLDGEKVITEARVATTTKSIAEIDKLVTAAKGVSSQEFKLKINTNVPELVLDLAKIEAALQRYQVQVDAALAPLYTDPIFSKNIVEGLSISEKQLIDRFMASGAQGILQNPFRPDVDLNPIIAQIQQRETTYTAARGAYKAITPPEELGLTANTSFMGTGDTGGTVVNVNINGSLISQNDLVAAVTDAVYATQRTGNSLIIEQ